MDKKFENLSVNVPSHENFFENETYSQNTSFIEEFSNESIKKRNVSFSHESSILYYDEDNATNSLQSISSKMFNISDDAIPRISHFEKDAIVVLEKLPQTLLDKYVKENDNCCQKESFPIASENDICTSKTSKILIERLPDNLLEMHLNYSSRQNSPEKENSEGETCALKHQVSQKTKSCKLRNPKTKRKTKKVKLSKTKSCKLKNPKTKRKTKKIKLSKTKSCKLRNPKTKRKTKKIKLSEEPPDHPIQCLNVGVSLPTESEIPKQNTVRELALVDNQGLLTEQHQNEFSVLCNKRLCVHLEKLDLNIPDIDAEIFPNCSKTALYITHENNISETSSMVSTNCDNVYKFTARLKRTQSLLGKTKRKKSRQLKKHKSKLNNSVYKYFSVSSLTKNNHIKQTVLTNLNANSSHSCVTDSNDDDLTRLCLPKSSFGRQEIVQDNSNKKLQNESAQSKGSQFLDSEGSVPLSHRIGVNFVNGSNSSNSQSCVTDDSSDDDLPFQSMTKNNFRKKQFTHANSSKKSQNKSIVNPIILPVTITNRLPVKESQTLSDSSEENYPITSVSEIDSVKMSSCPSDLSKNKNKDSEYHDSFLLKNANKVKRNHDHSYFRSLDDESNDENELTEALLKNVRHDNNKHLGSPFKKIKLDHSYHKSFNDTLLPIESSSIPNVDKRKSNTFSSRTDSQTVKTMYVKKNCKQNGTVSKNKKEISTVLGNGAFRNKRLSSKHNGVLSAKSKNNEKKSSHKNKKVFRRKQAEAYEMLITYLCKIIKSKSHKRAKKGKSDSTIQCKKRQVQSINNESENVSETTTVSNVTARAVCKENKNNTSEKYISKSKTEKVREKAVDKYRLGFLTKSKSLRSYNKCLASERMLLSKFKIKKKQKKELKKLFKKMKKVCHIKKSKI